MRHPNQAREVLDLFSAAAGGWSLGMHRAGYRTLAACEVEAWRRAVYAENNPHVRLYDDVRTLTADRLLADLGRLPRYVVGSPPCQDISSANTKGKGVGGSRSGLYFEAIRIIGEVRPRWFALENSANLRTRGADAVIDALEAIGYACWPCVVRAGDIDANHERPRAWLLGCDLAQVTDANGLGRDEGRSGGRLGLDLATASDPQHASGVRHEGGWPWRYGSDGVGAASASGRNAPNTTSLGRRSWSGGGESLDAGGDGRLVGDDDAHGTGDASDADQARQARQAHGCVESGVRQAEIADDGRGARWGADWARAGQVGVRPPNRGAADQSGPNWSLAHLADHLRLDDGLSAWLAGQRVQIGDGKGQSAASLIVEAFGDAVIPQIPEAIGNAIARTEAALAIVYGRAA